MMEKDNGELSVYVSDPFHDGGNGGIVDILTRHGYRVCDAIADARYLLINDLAPNYDLNHHRGDLRYAVEHDMVLCQASRGITCFRKSGVTDRLLFT